jgi:hypothetical protein
MIDIIIDLPIQGIENIDVRHNKRLLSNKFNWDEYFEPYKSLHKPMEYLFLNKDEHKNFNQTFIKTFTIKDFFSYMDKLYDENIKKVLILYINKYNDDRFDLTFKF